MARAAAPAALTLALTSTDAAQRFFNCRLALSAPETKTAPEGAVLHVWSE
ncbi:hypothetical protein [Malikia spinosa]|nr:hypothetical protein [Malikia spinosa]